MRKLVAGVGVNDVSYSVKVSRELERDSSGKRVREVIFSCPYYKVWENMLNRCYNEKYHIKRPSYKGCSVCEDWKYFSNFRDWMSNQKWEGMHLDKDLIDKGNKVYSKDTCMFIPPKINSFIINKNSNGFLEGVGWVKASSCFRAKCSNPLTKKNVSIGFYTDEYVAHIVWKNYKLSLIPHVCEDIENSTFIK